MTRSTAPFDPSRTAPFSDIFVGPNGYPLTPGGYGRATFAIAPRTPMAVSGSGCVIRDDTGRDLIDLHGNFTAMVHGYGHPAIVEAAIKAFEGGSAFGLPTMYEVDHAQHMLERMRYVDQIRYANSGTEAVMLAARLARAVTGRDKIVMVQLAYHGHSDLALVPAGALGHRGVPEGVVRDTLSVRINALDDLNQAFDSNPDQIAAVFIDPMPNRAGLIKVTPEYYATARRLCDQHGAVLVSDEVIALRLAHGGAAVESGIVPDLVTMGKIIGGGTPVGALAGKYELMNELNPFGTAIEHAGTFTGNPVTMAAGLTAMQLYTSSEVDRLNELGASLRDALRSVVTAHGWELRGDGSLFRFLPTGASTPEAARASQLDLWWATYERGLLLGQNLACALSTPMDANVVDDVTTRLLQAVQATPVGD